MRGGLPHLPSLTKASNSEFKALCCFHDEKVPSLCCNVESGQWYCHGCHAKGDLFGFYAQKHGLDVKTDFGKVVTGIALDFNIGNDRKPQITATYNYRDVGGTLLYQVVRFQPKNFRQRRPGPNRRWIWKLRNTPRVLYRLPELLKSKSQEVIIAEGEKDVENIQALGLTATPCAMGAGKWRPEYNEALRGKNIVLCPDNDAEGRKHMNEVGASLHGIAASLKWLKLPGLPEKGDVSDWIAQYDGKDQAGERLSMLIEGCDPWRPADDTKAEILL